MDGEVPGRRPAHREAADHDAVFVDGVVLLYAVHRLEGINFAGELVGAAVAAVEAQDEGAGRHELGVRLLAAVDEIQFGQVLTAAVAPKVEAVFVEGVRPEGRRHDQPVRLDGAVDAGDVAAGDESRGRGPGRLAVAQRLGPLVPLFQKRFGRSDFSEIIKLVIVQGVADGVVIDLHVRQQVEQGGLVFQGGAEVVDLLAEGVDAGL